MTDLMNSKQMTMTLKEITDLLEVRHDKAMSKVEKMAETKEFGQMSKTDICLPKGNGATQTIQTYKLDKRQSIAASSRLNTALLMRIIDRWQELENKPLTLVEIVAANANRLVELEKKAQANENRLKAIEHKLTNTTVHSQFYSILGYANLRKVKIDVTKAATLGRKASSLSKKYGITCGSVPDARFGIVKTYHEDILKEIIA